MLIILHYSITLTILDFSFIQVCTNWCQIKIQVFEWHDTSEAWKHTVVFYMCHLILVILVLAFVILRFSSCIWSLSHLRCVMVDGSEKRLLILKICLKSHNYSLCGSLMLVIVVAFIIFRLYVLYVGLAYLFLWVNYFMNTLHSSFTWYPGVDLCIIWII